MIARLLIFLKRHWILYVALLIIVTIALIGTSYVWYSSQNSSLMPSSIEKKLTFSPLVIPETTKNYSASDYKLASTEDKGQTLSYIAHTKYGTVSISQQSQPVQFVEIPEYKDRFLNNIAKQYDTVQSSSGTIYLGRLAKQNNKQLGVMLEKGLLVFLNPEKQLDNAQWRSLGDQLEILKVNN